MTIMWQQCDNHVTIMWQSWQSCANHDQGRQSPWVWQCTSFQSPSCQKFRWSVVCLCFQLVQPSLVFLQPTSCFMFLSALTTMQNHRCLFNLNWTVDSYIIVESSLLKVIYAPSIRHKSEDVHNYVRQRIGHFQCSMSKNTSRRHNCFEGLPKLSVGGRGYGPCLKV